MGTKNRSVRIRAWVKQPFSLALLFGTLTFFYQNCGSQFEIAGKSTWGTSSSNSIVLSELQQKSIGILTANCATCHGVQGLGSVSNILDVEHLKSSGLIVPGNPEMSPLFDSVISNRMPSTGPISSADKNVLRSWILALGGIFPSDETPMNLSFAMSIRHEPLSFKARLGKLSHLLGNANSSALNEVKADRIQLGDYDYANSVIPKVSWEATDMKNWIEAIEPVCTQLSSASSFAWPQGVENFLEQALGRGVSMIEEDILTEIDALRVSSQEKFAVFCVSTLSSLEFVAK